MPNSESIRNYTSAADITDYWLKNVAPKYFEMENVNTYRAGTLGLIMDIMSTTTEDTVHAMMISRREAYPNTAQYQKSLYLHAASRYMDAPMAVPATANVLLMIQQSELLKYGTQNGRLHTFVLDDTFIAHVDDIPFMLDYPITILSVEKENGKYAHTTHYDFYIDNTLAVGTDRYLPNKVMNYQGTEYVIVAARMRQIYKTYDNQLVTSNTIVNTVTMEFKFDGNLANFEVFYKETDSSPRIQLLKLMKDSSMSNKPFVWYKITDSETIELTFPVNAYFTPRLNSVVSIEIATTLGSKGNFDSYTSDIVSENNSSRYPYNAQVPVFGTVDGESKGGKDIAEMEEFRAEVLRAYSTNHTYISVHDIQSYFDTLMSGTNDRFKFVAKRDDSFIRLYGAFILMKDSVNNVIPTNTLDVYLDPLQEAGDFDVYSEAVKRFIIKPGALFTYRRTEANKYSVERIHDRVINGDTSDYDNGTHWTCSVCGNSYDGDLPFDQVLADETNEYKCPHCEATKDKFVKDNFIFTNPYLISISTDTFMAGYYLNSKSDIHELSYTAVNDNSIVQFIARHFKIERNAIIGENFYKFSVAISPSMDIELETIFQERNETIIAKHNGYISKIEFGEKAAYATVVYTSDPTIPPEQLLADNEEIIQVSSYIEKVDKSFRVCPICGHRMEITDWEAAKANGFMDGEDQLLCPTCGQEEGGTVELYEEKYIDFDYFPGYDLKFKVGDAVSKNDVLASAKPKDLGRIRLMMDLGDVMMGAAKRYVPLTLEEAHDEGTPYFIFSAYLSTDDMIDSSMIMSIIEGYAMQDGSSGHNHSIAIPIEGLKMSLHAFYQYREEDGLEASSRNPAHAYSHFNYAAMHAFTNTYTLQENDSITLIKSLDHTRGFLDEVERPKPDEPVDPDPPPTPPPDPDHPAGESTEIPDDPEHYVYLRSHDHERFPVVNLDDDRYPNRYLTVLKDGTEVPVEPVIVAEEVPPADNGSNVEPEDVPYGDNFTFNLRNCPFVSANWIKTGENSKVFIEKIQDHYEEIAKVQWTLENGFSIDMKYYNTYGKSKFYKIGNRSELSILDSVNIVISFGAAIVFPASSDVFRDNFRSFVKEFIEANDETVGNGIDLYIMNLVAAAKTQFDEIAYLEYYGLNDYDFAAQRITVMSDDEILKTVKADSFVPEFLNIVRETINGNIAPKVKLSIIETVDSQS